MTKPLLAILLLLPLSVSAGELDGKAISCASPQDGSVFFEFIDRRVKQWGLIEVETQLRAVSFTDPPPPAYRNLPDSIEWEEARDGDRHYFSLDRASLQLKRMSMVAPYPEEFWSCEVYTSITELWQSEIDEQMKNNKI